MRLTWKDAVTTLFMAVIVAGYVAFLQGTSLWLISSARGTTAAVLVLGMVGGCALSAAGDLYTRAQSRWSMAILVITTMLGIVALTAAVTGLITGSTLALAVLVTATIALWLTATIRHAFTAPAEPVNMRDVHEVIDPKRPAYH
jgi:hypothetical protein